MESIPQTHICSICSEVLIYPVSTKCKHIYCSKCIYTHLEQAEEKSCPVCRTELVMERFNPPVIKKLCEIVEKKYPEKVESRKTTHDAYLAELRRLKEIRNSIKIHFDYGYTLHTPYVPDKSIFQREARLYICLKDSEINENSLIQNIDFKIEDPPRTRQMKYAPFTTTIKKVYSEIPEDTNHDLVPVHITVTWQRWTKLSPTTYTFDLDLATQRNFQSSDFIYVRKTLTKNIIEKKD
ncbi:unnamed protein product [Moneuplotes crassus]|uniref:RING-type domain-containing protein n=1 Tax=Euplotes crassus TaxID=5936 RepID=A0AAD2D0T7_EUPCR|nr:unnamed protein product [Moneuplotes crassus]